MKEVWQASKDVSAELSLLSPVTSAVALDFAKSYASAAGASGEEIQQALLTMMRTGYGCRSVITEPTEQPALDPSSIVLEPLHGVQVTQNASELRALNEAVRRVAFDDFESVMTLPPEVWAGLLTMATRDFQRTLASSTVSWRELGKERIDLVLRYGYVLRCLDETLERPWDAS